MFWRNERFGPQNVDVGSIVHFRAEYREKSRSNLASAANQAPVAPLPWKPPRWTGSQLEEISRGNFLKSDGLVVRNRRIAWAFRPAVTKP
jgi:hypothetical protein